MPTDRLMTKEKNFQMRLELELFEKANKRASQKGISIAGYIRGLILADLEKAEASKDRPS